MSKKDVLIFLHLYLLAIKHDVNAAILEDFRTSMYTLIRESPDFSTFRFRFDCYRLQCTYSNIYKGFNNYLLKICEILDI